jgi:ParB-like chromosome segregation protein Spo0J
VQIKKVLISELKEAKYNPRKDLQPGDEEYKALKMSIENFGYVSPIIVNAHSMVIVGGHQRLKILREQGLNEIDVLMIDINEQNEKLLNLALNKIQGNWDMEKLKIIIEELKNDDYDMILTGFSNEEIDILINNKPEVKDVDISINDNSGLLTVCPKCHYAGEKDMFLLD